MNVCLYFHGFMLCFMLASTVHNPDCYFTSVYLWLCILFSFDCKPFANIRIHIDYVCAFAAFFFLSLLFLFAVLFCLYTVLGYVWVCNFPCLHLTFLVLLHAFWWWMLCLIVLFSVYFTSSFPYNPVFFLLVCLFLVGILCYFPLYMLLWLL